MELSLLHMNLPTLQWNLGLLHMNLPALQWNLGLIHMNLPLNASGNNLSPLA
jgi:hypothetical protein